MYHLVSLCYLVQPRHGNNKNHIKASFCIVIKKIVTKKLVTGILFKATVVSMATKSYNQLKLLNLVTMATEKNVYETFVMLINRG